ncbi:unnamed protein product [Polarella glacialis]|uniref:Uncharacterized protein n=1 Tax=Polarella glacialis TaxID=89957 RepID=A0A813KUF3_POLGL|nr:unnamed protein product [Polarella glacialis]
MPRRGKVFVSHSNIAFVTHLNQLSSDRKQGAPNSDFRSSTTNKIWKTKWVFCTAPRGSDCYGQAAARCAEMCCVHWLCFEDQNALLYKKIVKQVEMWTISNFYRSEVRTTSLR